MTRVRQRHYVCAVGASVKLHGYMSARVLELSRDPTFHHIRARVIVTARTPDARKGNIGPHGYRTGETLWLDARACVPRDCVYVQRGTCGRIGWLPFNIAVQRAEAATQ